MKILVSGSIVLYKNDVSVRKAINSFLETALPVKLFLIDNSPTDIIKRDIVDFLEDPRVEYIFNNRNLGFATAHNIALRKSLDISYYHLVLNPDVNFEPDVLPTIVEYMENNEDVGLLMPKVLYPNKNIQYICKLLPSPTDLIFRRFLPLHYIEKRLNKFELRFTGYNTQLEAPYLSGCFMFMRTALLQKAGLFDERYFLYLEDTDLSRRFSVISKNIYFPSVHIIHHHERGSYKNFRLLLIHSKSAISYFNKWGWWYDDERNRINEKTLGNLKTEFGLNTLKVKTA
jgi:GT2 family glycosyltransferase